MIVLCMVIQFPVNEWDRSKHNYQCRKMSLCHGTKPYKNLSIPIDDKYEFNLGKRESGGCYAANCINYY